MSWWRLTDNIKRYATPANCVQHTSDPMNQGQATTETCNGALRLCVQKSIPVVDTHDPCDAFLKIPVFGNKCVRTGPQHQSSGVRWFSAHIDSTKDKPYTTNTAMRGHFRTQNHAIGFNIGKNTFSWYHDPIGKNINGVTHKSQKFLNVYYQMMHTESQKSDCEWKYLNKPSSNNNTSANRVVCQHTGLITTPKFQTVQWAPLLDRKLPCAIPLWTIVVTKHLTRHLSFMSTMHTLDQTTLRCIVEKQGQCRSCTEEHPTAHPHRRQVESSCTLKDSCSWLLTYSDYRANYLDDYCSSSDALETVTVALVLLWKKSKSELQNMCAWIFHLYSGKFMHT